MVLAGIPGRTGRFPRVGGLAGCSPARRGCPLQRADRAALTAATQSRVSIASWTGCASEQQALSELLQRFQSEGDPEPDAEEAQWFLRDRNFDVAEAYEKLRLVMKWRRHFSPDSITLSSIAEEDACGKAYLHEYPDVDGQPVLVIRVARHIVGEFPRDSSQKLCIYYIEQAMNSRPPGVETILGVFDLREFSLKNADLQFVAFLIQSFFNYYPKRLGAIFMVGAPWTFWAPYKAVKPLVGKYADLIHFMDVEELQTYFKEGQVPEEFS